MNLKLLSRHINDIKNEISFLLSQDIENTAHFDQIDNRVNCLDIACSTICKETTDFSEKYMFETSIITSDIITLRDTVKEVKELISENIHEIKNFKKHAKRNRSRFSTLITFIKDSNNRVDDIEEIINRELPMVGVTSKIVAEVLGIKRTTFDSCVKEFSQKAILGFGAKNAGAVFDPEHIAELLFNRFFTGKSKAVITKTYLSIEELEKALIDASKPFYKK